MTSWPLRHWVYCSLTQLGTVLYVVYCHTCTLLPGLPDFACFWVPPSPVEGFFVLRSNPLLFSLGFYHFLCLFGKDLSQIGNNSIHVSEQLRISMFSSLKSNYFRAYHHHVTSSNFKSLTFFVFPTRFC